MLSSIITLTLINNLLNKEINKIPKKFETCLKRVYNYLMLKASNFSNILSMIDNSGNKNNNFNNNDLNDIILKYKSDKDPKNNKLDNFISLKSNIKDKFIEDFPLNISLSPNVFTNLLKYIANNNNNNNKTMNDYYSESIFYYISLTNIINKEPKISDMQKSIVSLYNTIFNNNGYNINHISDIKSFYVFIFFLERINSFISSVIRIEDIENYVNDTSSFFSDDLLKEEFIKKTINIIDCFCSFMHQYIILVIKKFSYNNTDNNIHNIHSFILKKLKSKINKNCAYFTTNNKNFDDMSDYMDKLLKEKYGQYIMLKGYSIIEKITNNIKIYSRDDEEICKKIDFIKFINFDGIQYLTSNSIFKSN